MKQIHLPENITEFAVHHLTQSSERGVLPFTDIKTLAQASGLTPVKAAITLMVEGYKHTLETRAKAIQEASDKTKLKVTEVKIAIQHLKDETPAGRLLALKQDVEENKELLAKLVGEQQQEISFVKDLSDGLKAETALAQRFPMVLELSKCLDNLIETLIKHQVAQVRKIQHYQTSLIVPDTLDTKEIDNCIDNRISVLKNQLQVLEENISTYAGADLRIATELKEISEILSNLSV